MTTEMITVIVSFQLRKRFLRRPAVRFSHRLYLWHEVIGDFLFCESQMIPQILIELDPKYDITKNLNAWLSLSMSGSYVRPFTVEFSAGIKF